MNIIKSGVIEYKTSQLPTCPTQGVPVEVIDLRPGPIDDAREFKRWLLEKRLQELATTDGGRRHLNRLGYCTDPECLRALSTTPAPPSPQQRMPQAIATSGAPTQSTTRTMVTTAKMRRLSATLRPGVSTISTESMAPSLSLPCLTPRAPLCPSLSCSHTQTRTPSPQQSRLGKWVTAQVQKRV